MLTENVLRNHSADTADGIYNGIEQEWIMAVLYILLQTHSVLFCLASLYATDHKIMYSFKNFKSKKCDHSYIFLSRGL
jgi:hypothetical protein